MSLDSELEPLFWKHVYKDIPDYYFFILDVKEDKEKSKVTLALDAQNRIKGIMLVYRDYIVQLRGSIEAVNALLARLDVEKAEINSSIEYNQLVIPSQYEVKKIYEIMLMTLRKGEETPKIRHNLVRLSTADAEDIAALMRATNPPWWSEVKAEQIAEKMPQRVWLGIKSDGKLVSIGGARIDDWGSLIGTVATHEDYRNRGYATSIVSALVEQMLKQSNLALIYVETKNPPAIRAYTKAGFKPYKNYTVITAEKRREKNFDTETKRNGPSI